MPDPLSLYKGEEDLGPCKDMQKYRAYSLLYDFIKRKEKTLQPLDLPKY